MNGLTPPGRARLAWCSAISACLVTGLIIASGCDDDRHVTIPETRGGAIEGWVSDGLPIDPRDVVITINDYERNDLSYTIRVRPDSSGYYVVSVPVGPARVSLRASCGREIYHRAAGLTHNRDAADTVMVADEVCRVDFACGHVAVDIGMPPELQGESVRCGLLGPGDSPRNYHGCSVNYAERLLTSLRLVKPGDYRLVLQGNDLGYAYLPATLDTLEAEMLTVRAGEETRHTSEIPALTILSGAATGSWQSFGFERPRIQVWHDDEQLEEFRADGDGTFDVRLFAAGAFKLLVSIENTAGYVGGVDLASATVFAVAPGEHRTGITYVESGLVLTMVGEYDIWESVFAYDVYDDAGRTLLRFPGRDWSLSTRSNPILIPNLPPGEVRVTVRPTDQSALWLGQFYDRQDSLATADPITVPAGGQIAHATMTLERGGRLRGRLLTADGAPCPQWSVVLRVYAVAGEAQIESYYSGWQEFYDGDTGEYVLNQFVDGAYNLSARHSGGAISWYPGVADRVNAGVIIIEDHAEVVLDDWQLPN